MQIELEGYIHAQYSEIEQKIIFEWWPYESWGGSVMVQAHTLKVEVPDDFDPRPGQVEQLREEIQNLRADTAAKVGRIEDRIQNLLALEGPK